MKRHLFATMLLAAMSATAMAQTSIDTALEIKEGWNEWTPETKDAVTAYWKYTAEENTLLTINYDTGIYINAVAVDEEGNQVSVSGAQESYVESHFAVLEGKTIYITASLYDGNKGSFTAKMTPDEDLGKGLAETDPMPVDTAKVVFMGDPYAGFGDQTTYATYTADKNGLLVMTSPTAVGSITVDGIIGLKFEPTFAIDRSSQSRCKMPVEKGKTYEITFTNYGPFVFTATTEKADAGSLYRPFTLVEGENTVPAEAGDYYYIYTNEKTGYGVVSGDDALPGGQVKIFPEDKSLIESGYTLATSEEGSFDTRWEMTPVGTIYYVCVSKAESTDGEQTMTFGYENYKAGDKEENPIMIEETPAEVTTEAAGTTVYYGVEVAAGVEKFLNVEALSEITSGYTKVEIYPEGFSYSAASGNKTARMQVSGGETGQLYIVKWTSSEAEPITFSVTMDDIKQGDLITNPLTAVKGENTIEGEYTKYYQYTATLTGKLIFAGTANMLVTFPMGTGAYDGVYTTTRTEDLGYLLDVTEGTTYLIKIENPYDGDTFTIDEREYELGEGRTNPIIVEDGAYTLGAETAANLWLAYTAEKDGILTIASDIPYNNMGYDEIYYSKGEDGTPVAISTTYFDGTTASTIYRAEVAAKAGDVYLVNLKMTTPYEGKQVTFTLRDFEAGESVATAIVLEDGEQVEIPEATAAMPAWYMVTLEPGDVTITTDSPFETAPLWFASKEDALAGENGTEMTFDNSFDDDWNMVCTWKHIVTEAGTYYIMIDGASYGGIHMTLDGPVTTGIGSVEAEGGCITIGDGCVSVRAEGAVVTIYTASGMKVAESKMKGNETFNLGRGMYIVKVDDTVRKIAVK